MTSINLSTMSTAVESSRPSSLNSSSEITVIEDVVPKDSSSHSPTTTTQIKNLSSSVTPKTQIHNHSSSESSTTTTQTLNRSSSETATSQIENPEPTRYFKRILGDFFISRSKRSVPKIADNTKDAAAATSADHSGRYRTHVDEKLALSNLIDHDLAYIREFLENLEEYKTRTNVEVDEVHRKFEKLKDGGSERDLREIKKTVQKLKLKIPSKYKIESVDESDRNDQSKGSAIGKQAIDNHVLVKMPKLCESAIFESSSAFKDIQTLYDGLGIELKLCLLCFSVFPKNAIVKKRVMVYWWIGEGFVPPAPRDDATAEQIANGKTAEEFADEFFHKLLELGFIEPVRRKRSLVVGSCRLHPFVRAAVVKLAEKAKFFNFDNNGEPIEDFSCSFRACLMGKKGLTNMQELEKLHVLFNVDEEILDFKPELFLRMKNINVLYLGRWQTSATHHIELEETNFLNSLGYLKHLRLFSLQGVSRIMELPSSISQLKNLTILDLRACHSLEVMPNGIGSLRSLTHLDMSECYLLDHMPKELSSLSELQVLKGFVIGGSPGKNSCTLDDLAKLAKLKKLNLYTGLKEFPTDTHLRALQGFQVLLKLTIEWGGGASQERPIQSKTTRLNDGGVKQQDIIARRAASNKQKAHGSLTRSVAFRLPTLPSQLQKLDLQCFPVTTTPSWLMPSNLKMLKKLYIRGGKFSDLGQYQALDDDGGGHVLPMKDTWSVEQLRLKYLNELEMDWRELQDLFPNLIYLEKLRCPKLTFFPCDESGVWMNKKKQMQMQDMAA